MKEERKHLIAIGEALIDFAPGESGKPIKDTESFLPKVGGAPANVCGAFVKLGGEAVMLTKLGEDPFGDKILEELAGCGIDVSHIIRTKEAATSLAFVALHEDGNREFSFIRMPGADMLYHASDVPVEVFDGAFALHFCSVSLGDFPMKEAHKKAIQYAKEKGVLVSFDPNIRKQLWDSEEALKKAVDEFLPYADIMKISDEEMDFITGENEPEAAAKFLLDKGVSLVLVTLGTQGSKLYTKTTSAEIGGNGIKPIDTTGAGDGFIGSFLYELSMDSIGLEKIPEVPSSEWERYLKFSDCFCGESIQKKGAIASYITREEVLQKLKG